MFKLEAEIRKARPSDASRIAEVHAESWKYAYYGIVPHAALNRMISRRDANWWARAIRKSAVILVLEFNNEVIGYATLGPNRISTFHMEGEIYEIYLKPEYQGVGFGSKLFLKARGELMRRGYKGVVVWSLSDNEPAMNFYENSGGKAIANGSEHFDDVRLEKTAFAWDC